MKAPLSVVLSRGLDSPQYTHRTALHIGGSVRDDEREDVQPPSAVIRCFNCVCTTRQHHEVVCWDGNIGVGYVAEDKIHKISCYCIFAYTEKKMPFP